MKRPIAYLLLLFTVFACGRDNELTTLADFLSKDDTDTRILRQYKTWEVGESTIEIPGKPTLVYKKGQPIQGNFDPSKISFVFNSSNTFQNTDETGKPGQGTWLLSGDKQLILRGGSVDGTYNILTLNRTNFDYWSTESFDENIDAVVTIKMIPKR